MSTKAIREALSLARARKGFGDTEEEMLADDAATKALQYIERAVAESLRLMHEEYPEDCVHLVIDLLKPIAKDAP